MKHGNEEARKAERRDVELEEARELLERTARFLARCAEDPSSAMESEDPLELMRGLESLAADRDAADAYRPPSIPSIQIRRRRSA